MKKYLSRFGFIFIMLLIIFIMWGYIPDGTYKLIAHKIVLVVLGTGLSEIVWLFFFKPVFGRIESIDDPARLKSIILFRGILYASIILGLTIGV